MRVGVASEQIANEFAHYDENADGVVKIDEFINVRKNDQEEFYNWFKKLAEQDGDSYHMESWEFDGKESFDFWTADQDQDSRINEYEACQHHFSSFSQICDGINWNSNGEIASEYFVYIWYGMDTDRDEKVSLVDFVTWWQVLEYGRYAWMSADDIKSQLYEAWDADQDGVLTFAEAKDGWTSIEELEMRKNGIWSAINPNWQEYIDQDFVIQNWSDEIVSNWNLS